MRNSDMAEIVEAVDCRMLNVLLISDGKPGHYKKSAAIADAITKRRRTTLAWLDVRMRLPVFHDLLRPAFRHHHQVPDLKWLRATHRFPQESLPDSPPDLIISSGGKTAFANAWLAQYYGCPNIFIGQTRGIHLSYFSRNMVCGNAVSNGGNYESADPRLIPGPIPTEISREMLDEAAWKYLATRDAAFARQRHWTMLIGGNSGGFRYGERDWRCLAGAMETLAERHQIRWLVTTSRRTPRRAEQALRQHSVRRHIDDLLIFRKDPRRVFNALLACGDVVFCTEDSGSMLTEASVAGKPAFSIRPRRAVATVALDQLLEFYIDAGRLKRVAIDEMSGLTDEDVSTGFHCAPVDELEAACERILEVLTPRNVAA